MAANQKGSSLPAAGRPLGTGLLHAAECSIRGVFDPIAVSRLRGRSRFGAAKVRLDQNQILSAISASLR
jgi:hypothetical protein